MIQSSVTPQLPPLSLYVHMPWCVRKCPYCDFNSHAAPAAIPQAEYIDALLAESLGRGYRTLVLTNGMQPMMKHQARPARQATSGSFVARYVGSMIRNTTMNMCGTLGP